MNGWVSPILKMTTPRTITGMPCVVTQVTSKGVSYRDSFRLRTVCSPGSTTVPVPVTILKSSPSAVALFRLLRPERISASSGSATRQTERKMMNTTRTAISSPPNRYIQVGIESKNSVMGSPPATARRTAPKP